MYNGMITPLVPFAIRGVVWYQGESNAANELNYRWEITRQPFDLKISPSVAFGMIPSESKLDTILEPHGNLPQPCGFFSCTQ